jgi:hypothetical protein
MSATVYTTSILKSPLHIPPYQGVVPKPVKIASLELPGGFYVVFAKAVVATIYDQWIGDSAIATFLLEAPGVEDKAVTMLWHSGSSDSNALPPIETVSLQLAFGFAGRVAAHPKGGSAVEKLVPLSTSVDLTCSSVRGTLEISNIVITAIKVDSIHTQA